MAAGVLVAGSGGLCSAFFEVSFWSNSGGLILIVPVVLGLLPIGAGVGLFIAGRTLMRE